MTGGSWGGFNSLQLAARRPPALRAVMPYFFSDDRYADDVHYRGGCVLAMDMLHWANCMLSFNAMPPDPRFVGEGWRDAWIDRLERTPPFIEEWLSHQRRDAYWKHGSVCEDYAAIECPVYAIGGWTDGYTDAVLRVLEGLPGPRKGLIGPWGHVDPVRAVPGPSIGMLQEAVRWWDHWLKGIDNGIMDGPMLTAWMQDWIEPAAAAPTRPGRWVGEPSWPSPRLERQELALGAGTLGAPARSTRSLRGVQTCGLVSGAWCADGHSADLPPDQRGDDGHSLCFDSAPLEQPLEILGFPEATLRLAVDRPLALVCVRLCDIAPDGSSLLVTRGLLNLTHRSEPRAPRAARARPRLHRVHPARLDRAPLRSRPPDPARRLADLLAVGLALARAGHAHARDRRREQRSPSPSGRRTRVTARSGSASRRSRPPIRPRRSGRASAAGRSPGISIRVSRSCASTGTRAGSGGSTRPARRSSSTRRRSTRSPRTTRSRHGSTARTRWCCAATVAIRPTARSRR